ncbi:hypothetical protein CLOM_g19803 [Closterium sp. NIES-68]|nr:hypothetical protein CLOM_g19803 [Closterium sp. NIES-68]
MDSSLLLPRPSRPFTPSQSTVRNAFQLKAKPSSSISPCALSAKPFPRKTASARTCVSAAAARPGGIPPREVAHAARQRGSCGNGGSAGNGGSGGRGTVAAASLKRPPVGLGAEGALAEEVAAEAVEDLLGEGEGEGGRARRLLTWQVLSPTWTDPW